MLGTFGAAGVVGCCSPLNTLFCLYPSKNDCQLFIGLPLCSQLFAVCTVKKSVAFSASCLVSVAYFCTSKSVGIFSSKKCSLSLFSIDCSNTNSVRVFEVLPPCFCSTPLLVFKEGLLVFVGDKSIASCTFLGKKITLFDRQTF